MINRNILRCICCNLFASGSLWFTRLLLFGLTLNIWGQGSSISALKIDRTPPTVTLTIAGQAGNSLELQSTPSLGANLDWTTLTLISLTNNTQIWVQTNFAANQQRFFRLKAGSSNALGAPISIPPGQGGKLSLADGAVVQIPIFWNTNGVQVSFTKTVEIPVTPETNGTVVSGEYQVKWQGEYPTNGFLDITVPLNREQLPSNVEAEQIMVSMVPEYYDEATASWQRVGTLWKYNSTNATATFEVRLTSLTRLTKTVKAASIIGKQSWIKDQDVFGISFRLRYRMYNAPLVTRGGPFVIQFYPPKTDFYNSIPSNDEWPRRGSGQLDAMLQPPVQYNFINDLFECMLRGWRGLTNVQSSTGWLAFGRLLNQTQIRIYVLDVGPYEGVTPQGGPILLSSKRLNDWSEMRGTAVHELVHYAQGFNYSSFESANRWFIEATAQYYACQFGGNFDAANPMEPRAANVQDQRVFLGGATNKNEYLADYLQVEMTAGIEGSQYAMGHFLSYLEAVYPNIAGDVLSTRGTYFLTSGSDLNYLRSAILSKGGIYPEGVSAVGMALARYARAILPDPEATDGFVTALKDCHAKRYAQIIEVPSASGWSADPTTTGFSENRPYKHLCARMPFLSTVYFSGELSTTKWDGLFVIAPQAKPSTGLQSITYTFLTNQNTHNTDYQGRRPIDSDLVFPYAKPLLIPCYGPKKLDNTRLMEQMIINTSETDTPQLQIDYYLLYRPEITQVGQGTTGGLVVWKTRGLGTIPGGIPRELINGFDVYLRTSKGAEKLNQNRIPLQATAGADQTFESPKIDPIKNTTNDVVVVVWDNLGNSWPQDLIELKIFDWMSPNYKNSEAVKVGTRVALGCGGTYGTNIVWSAPGANVGPWGQNGDILWSASSPGFYRIYARLSSNPLVYDDFEIFVYEKYNDELYKTWWALRGPDP